MEVFSIEKLTEHDLRRLAQIYVGCWKPVLEKEVPFSTSNDLIGDVFSQLESRLALFPQGQLVCRDASDGILGGVSALMVSAKRKRSRKVDYSKVADTWHTLTGNGYFDTHNLKGNLLVCAAIYVDPAASKKGVSRHLLHAETALAQERGLVACSYTRPVGFRHYLEALEAEGFVKGFDHKDVYPSLLETKLEDYLSQKLPRNKLLDPNVGMHTHFGAHVVRLLPNARPADTDSCGYCVLMEYPKEYVIPLR